MDVVEEVLIYFVKVYRGPQVQDKADCFEVHFIDASVEPESEGFVFRLSLLPVADLPSPIESFSSVFMLGED